MVVISAQPAVATTVVHRPVGDHFMILSVVMTILCVMCGGVLALLCTIPALVLALIVRRINQCPFMGRGGLGERGCFTYLKFSISVRLDVEIEIFFISCLGSFDCWSCGLMRSIGHIFE